jgi:chemotaxis signal transduction protein
MLPRRSSQAKTVPTRTVAVFALNGRHFAVSAEQVIEVVRIATYTPLPCEDPAHLGVVLHRETVIPLVDLGPQLGVPCPHPVQSPGLCLLLRTDSGKIACPIEQVLGLAPATDKRISQHSTLHSGVGIFRADAWETPDG